MKIATFGSQYAWEAEGKSDQLPKNLADLKRLLAKVDDENADKIGQLLISSNFLERFSSIFLSK